MWQTVLAQARAFGLSLALGLGLGLYYDFFRGLRRQIPRLTGLCDALFSLGCLLALLAFGLYAMEGDLRPYLIIGTALAFWGYIRFLGRFFLPVFKLLWLPVGLIHRGVKKFFRFLKNFAKFLFATGKKWVTIRGDRSVEKPNPGGETH